MKFLFAVFILTGFSAITFAQSKLDYTEFDRLTKTHVNAQGLVNYAALQKELPALESFINQLSTISPDKHPQLFADDNEKLRYFLTAYNAWVLQVVTKAYPKKDTLWGKLLFKDKPIKLGGQDTSLNGLEHGIIRKRFADPRVHFYLNCAARSCPPLQQGAIPEGKTDEWLTASARKFINSAKYVSFDPVTKKLRISKIFDWFAEDFLTYLKTKQNQPAPHIVQYLLLYAEGELKNALAQVPLKEIKVSYFDYDRSLNEQ
ncbi:MAG: DUF547 domain-containing protein [Blastocatellia bacterium]|nr:DUF547 domain-containing protein [Blastocatellia bacterium]